MLCSMGLLQYEKKSGYTGFLQKKAIQNSRVRAVSQRMSQLVLKDAQKKPSASAVHRYVKS